MFKKSLWGAMALAIFVSVNFVGFAAFEDVGLDYEYYDSVEYLHMQEILVGDSDTGTFRPFDNLNRAEFATVLVRLIGYDPVVEDYHDCFPDVTNQWYAPTVCLAKDLGVVTGYNAGPMAGMYGPGEPLLNAELIAVLSRLAKWNVSEGGEWYGPSWAYAVKHGITVDEDYAKNAVRGEMAEMIFRTSVVDYVELQSYYVEAGDEYRRNLIPTYFEFAEEEDEESGLDDVIYEDIPSFIYFENVDDSDLVSSVVSADASGIPVLEFSAFTYGDYDVEIDQVGVYFSEDTDLRNIAALYLMDDDSGEVIFSEDTKMKLDKSTKEMPFSQPVVIAPDEIRNFTVYADFDWEVDSPVQVSMMPTMDVITTGVIDGDFVIDGPVITRDPDFYSISDDPEYPELCANWDPEYNLPYPSEDEGVSPGSEPGEAGEPAEATGEHVIKPIDQGERGICAAASLYSSLRWFEERFGINLVENGSGGLEAIVAKAQGHANCNVQDEEIEKYLEGLNECIDVEYDTQAGLNVECSDLKEYHDKGCDIPLAFRCQKINYYSGEVIEGEDAKEWGHRVDLTDVVINSADDDQCTITFANSWSDPAHPGEDLDGLGAGRYEQAEYNDDTETFNITSPWADHYECKLRAAMYICIDEDEC